jgi:hypothetical protein
MKKHPSPLVTRSQLLEGLKCESQIENNGRAKSRGMLPGSQHFKRVEGRAGVSGWHYKLQLLTRAYTKPTQGG